MNYKKLTLRHKTPSAHLSCTVEGVIFHQRVWQNKPSLVVVQDYSGKNNGKFLPYQLLNF